MAAKNGWCPITFFRNNKNPGALFNSGESRTVEESFVMLLYKKLFGRMALVIFALVFVAGCVPRLPDSVKQDRNIEYAKVGTNSLLLDIYSPKQPVGKLPIVLWIHGGSWKLGSKDPCPIGFMATQNLAIVSMNYRLSGVAPYPAQIFDCKGAVRWLRANADKYGLDADHVGVFGASAGGHLAALLGTTAGVKDLEGDVGGNLNYSSRVQVVCAFYPPTDLDKLVTKESLRTDPTTDVGRFLGGALNDKLDVAALANPVRYASNDSAPFYILHGASDKLVPVSQSQLLYDALKKAGVEVHLAIVPGGHGIIAPPNRAMEIYKFFQAHMGMTPKPG